ncbi:MAG: hypothetical protein LC789_06215, partial [Actinobacteria bacterium]|nr:hypothetical protein [Actinomycetota bacterium]
FRSSEAGRRAYERTRHATAFVRNRGGGHRGCVDLHRTIATASIDEQRVWRTLVADSEDLIVGGVAVRTPSVIGRCLLLALHAAQHGVEEPKPLEDLRRGLRAESSDVWASAAGLADGLACRAAFNLGLALVDPSPVALAERAAWRDADPLLRIGALGAPARGSHVLVRLMDLPWRQRLAAVGRHAFPSRALLTATQEDGVRRAYLAAVWYRLAELSRLLPTAWSQARSARR